MASSVNRLSEFSSKSLYKTKVNPIMDLRNQDQRRQEALKRQKEKRESIVLQLRLCSIDNENDNQTLKQSQSRSTNRNNNLESSLGVMLAEWLYTPPEDIFSWFIVPCPIGRRCLVVHQSNQTRVYDKRGKFIRKISTNLPKQSVLYCIYDQRSSTFHIIDIIMWNGCDYSIQIECSCRFFMLLSLEGDQRLLGSFKIIPRATVGQHETMQQAEDGYLFYHPSGFYESGYSPLVCWLKPFMVEEILGIELPFSVTKPDGYTTAKDYMLEEQTNRKDQSKLFEKSQKKKNSKIHEPEMDENQLMATE